jgi:hypothetical protein
MKSRLLLVVDHTTTKFDVSSAKIYGDLVEIPGAADLTSPFKTEELVKVIDSFIEEINYDPDNDGLIITGNVIVVAITFGYLLARFGYVKSLFYDATKHTYAVRRVTMPSDLIEVE